MVKVVGFPQQVRRTVEPGQIIVAEIDTKTVFCLQGIHYAYVLIGHGRPPCRAWGGFDGPNGVLPGELQFRPLRDRPWAMSWRTSPRPGDLVIGERGTFLAVDEPNHPTLGKTVTTLIDPTTGTTPPGAITGPVFQGWELVWFPLPNRPMVLGAFDPDARHLAAAAARG